MKFLSRQCCLSLALLASMSLVGCGGGGGSSDIPPGPTPTPSSVTTTAAKAVVSPIVKNADAILSGVPTNASVRFSVDEDENYFNVSEANSIIKNLFDVDSFVRMATSLDGMVRDDRILFGGEYPGGAGKSVYNFVASLSGDVYERTTYEYDYKTDQNIPIAVYKIKGCSGSVDSSGILRSLNVNKGAKFEIKNEKWYFNYSYDGTGKSTKESVLNVSGSFKEAFGCKGEISTTNNDNPSEVTIVYNFSQGFGLTVDKYTYEEIEKGSKVTGKLNVDLSGITGTVTRNANLYDGRYLEFVSSTENLTVKQPISVALTNIEATDGNSNANIKSIKVIANKVTKAARFGDSLFADVEAHIDVEANNKDQSIKIGSNVLGFTIAKIDVTGMKCQKEMEDAEMLANAKAKLDAKEETNKITITAEYDYAKKTATAKLINNGDTTVTDGIMVFNFKTADITATKADVLNNCDGALLDVTAVEKDGAISKRSYKVVDGKLELLKKNDRIEVTIPKDLPQSGSDIAKAAENAKTSATAKDDTTAIFKVGKKSDGSTVATFDKLASGNNKDVKINVAAKDKVIISVGFYGSEFTIVFAFDTAKNIIKGSVFKGKVENAKLEDKNPVATFASTDGKTVTLFGDDSSSTTFNAAN